MQNVVSSYLVIFNRVLILQHLPFTNNEKNKKLARKQRKEISGYKKGGCSHSLSDRLEINRLHWYSSNRVKTIK